VLGSSAEDIQRTFLLRRRYYELLESTVVELFAGAKEFAEKTYGHELEARAHATWAESPTCDSWRTGSQRGAPRQYEYTPDFWWSNTIHQAASACDDYFAWNDFLNGQDADHLSAVGLKVNAHQMPLFYDKEKFHIARGEIKAKNFLYADGHIKNLLAIEGTIKHH